MISAIAPEHSEKPIGQSFRSQKSYVISFKDGTEQKRNVSFREVDAGALTHREEISKKRGIQGGKGTHPCGTL